MSNQSNNLPKRLTCPICYAVYQESDYGSAEGYSEGIRAHHATLHPEVKDLSWYGPEDVTDPTVVDGAFGPKTIDAYQKAFRPPMDDDPINPNHYKLPNGHEAIEVTENLNGNGAQAVNYIIRATRRDGLFKSDPLEDLKKAAWFIDREIQYLRQTAAIAKYAPKEAL